MENIEDNKVVNIIIQTTLVFYEELPRKDTWGSNNVVYDLYYSAKDGILNVHEVGAFGDRELVKRLQDRRSRGITVDEMLENISEIKNMTYKEFKERIIGE